MDNEADPPRRLDRCWRRPLQLDRLAERVFPL